MPLPTLRRALRDISIYESKGCIFIVGYNDLDACFRILEVNRPVVTIGNDFLSLRQDPERYSAASLDARLRVISRHFSGLELVAEHVACLWGFVRLLDSYYLIYVSKARAVGNILGHTIFTIERSQIFPITYKVRASAEEARYRALLASMDLNRNFYFSGTYDLTQSYQSNAHPEVYSRSAADSAVGVGANVQQQYVRPNDMFVWNCYAVKPLLALEASSSYADSVNGWIVPIIHGFFKQQTIQFAGGHRVKFALIARRSRFFAGTRYLRRGTNSDGHVANEVETEQIFVRDFGVYELSGTNRAVALDGSRGRVSSIVQCRGSIPIYWSQTNLYSPKPDFQLERPSQTREETKNHFRNLFARYGRHVQVFNLVKQTEPKPKEMLLGRAYKEVCSYLNSLLGPSTQCGYCHGVGSQSASAPLIDSACSIPTSSAATLRDPAMVCAVCKRLAATPSFGHNGTDTIEYAEYDFLAHSKHSSSGHSSLFDDLEKYCEYFFSKFGLYVDPPCGSDVYASFPGVESDKISIASEQKSADASDEADVPVDVARGSVQSCRVASEVAAPFLAPADGSDSMAAEVVELGVGDASESDEVSTLRMNETLIIGDIDNTGVNDSDNAFVGFGAPIGFLQYGILRTNCVDCLDRTNVAQFCYARVAISRQLRALGILPTPKSLARVVRICMDVWAEHGDCIAVQYGGSGAMHRVAAEEEGSGGGGGAGAAGGAANEGEKGFTLTGGAKNALVAAQRYYSNVLSDYERQNAMDIMLGIFKPSYDKKHIWDLKLRPEHIRHGSLGRRESESSLLIAKRAGAQPPTTANTSQESTLSAGISSDEEIGFEEGDLIDFRDDNLSADRTVPSEGAPLGQTACTKGYPGVETIRVFPLTLTLDNRKIGSHVDFHTSDFEIISFENVLSGDFETPVVDKLPFQPFPLASEWRPIAMDNRPRFAEESATNDDHRKPMSATEQSYSTYIRYFEQGIADPSSSSGLEYVVGSVGVSDNVERRILDGLSSQTKGAVLRLLLQQNGNGESKYSNKVAEISSNSCVPGMNPSKSEVSSNDATGAVVEGSLGVPRKLSIVEKWSESQKLASIFMPYGMSSFPEYGTISADATPSEMTNATATSGLDMSESSKHSASAPMSPEEPHSSSAPDATREASDITPQQLFNSTSVAALKSKMLKSVDIAKNVSGAVMDKLSEGGGDKRRKWSFWGSDKKKSGDDGPETAPYLNSGGGDHDHAAEVAVPSRGRSGSSAPPPALAAPVAAAVVTPPTDSDGGDHVRSRTAGSRGSSIDVPPVPISSAASSRPPAARTHQPQYEQRQKDPEDGKHKDLAARINKAVDAAVREREDRLSAENAQLRAALIAMQRQIDDLHGLTLVSRYENSR